MQGLLAFQRYFDFSGRSARAEYWQFVGLFIGAIIVAYVLDLAISGPYGTPTLAIIVFLAMVVPAYAVSFRRIHDRGRTGWWLIASIGVSLVSGVLTAAAVNTRYTAVGDVLVWLARLASIANFGLGIFLFVEFVQRGDDGANQYGPDPLAEPRTAPTVGETFARTRSAVQSPPTVRAAAVPPKPTEDPIEQIERLAKLRDAGMLTDEEFAQQKTAYLSRL